MSTPFIPLQTCATGTGLLFFDHCSAAGELLHQSTDHLRADHEKPVMMPDAAFCVSVSGIPSITSTRDGNPRRGRLRQLLPLELRFCGGLGTAFFHWQYDGLSRTGGPIFN